MWVCTVILYSSVSRAPSIRTVTVGVAEAVRADLDPDAGLALASAIGAASRASRHAAIAAW
jgi:hypothetical protein